jgi:hypothetical protein
LPDEAFIDEAGVVAVRAGERDRHGRRVQGSRFKVQEAGQSADTTIDCIAHQRRHAKRFALSEP